MIKVGLIGGIGPESTIKYYQLVIKKFREITDGVEYPELCLVSIDMDRMLKYISENDKKGFIDFMRNRIDILIKSGVSKVFICSNTPHVYFDELQSQVEIEMISIVDETLNHISSLGLKKCGLLGTKFTMSKGFYSSKGMSKGIEIIIPNEIEQDLIHSVYMNELVFNINNRDSKMKLIEIISRLIEEEGIEGLILGGTELSLMFDQTDFDTIKILDTCLIHVDSIIDVLVSEINQSF